MGETVEKFGFAVKYKSVGELFSTEILPIIDSISRLGVAADGFASAANSISHINFTEQHEIKELLELVFEIRRSAEDLHCLLDKRLDAAIKTVESGVYDIKNIKEAKEEQEK
ncbi:MAG: hypothetical protein JG776_1671 [Caloramator sp.]|uniref:hypothetical protein n=1 Tax=Caloramator sp. TaxID=1871330 RepID=UPI001DD30B1D|nr:hypothetical protein [Caloramator sp.]MBZ4663956.1 hypothetical protein [Caloramator sp.]